MPKVIDTNQVINFLTQKKNFYGTEGGSVKSFYELITDNRTNFNFDINSPTGRDGYTCLQAACIRGDAALVKAMLKMGANPNHENAHGETALSLVIRSGNLELIKLLVKYGAKLDSYGGDASYTYLELAKKCTEKGLGVDNAGDYDSTTDSFKDYRSSKIYQYLCDAMLHHYKNKTEVRLEDDYHYWNENKSRIQNALILAVQNNNLQKAKEILETGRIDLSLIYINLTESCLRVAAKNGFFDMVKLLSEHHADLVDAQNGNSETIAETARKAGHPEIAEYLIKKQKERYEILRCEFDKNRQIYFFKEIEDTASIAIYNGDSRSPKALRK